MNTTTISSHRNMLPVIFSLAWPTMLEQLMQTAVQYIDTAMVGTLGTAATAAVGATTTVSWLITSSISALGVGFLSYIAQAYGAGKKHLASRAAAQCTLAILVVGLFFTAVCVGFSSMIPVWMQVDPAIQPLAAQYFFVLYLPMLPRTVSILYGTILRAAGDTKTPMKIGLFVNILNVIGNFLLIYPSQTHWGIRFPGAGWGVVGAAASSALAFTVGGILTAFTVWNHPELSPKGEPLRPDWQVLRPCLNVAIPNMLQRFGTSLGYVAFASMINALGQVSAAAHTIANTVESAFYIPGYGMQTAAATLAGNALGAKDRHGMKELGRMLIRLETGLMILSGGLLFAFAPQLMRLFSKNEAVILLGVTILRMVALSEPVYGISIVIEGMMQGVGKTITPFLYNILGMWGVRILGTLLCTKMFGLGLVSAWACMIAHNILLFFLFSFHFFRGKWNPLD